MKWRKGVIFFPPQVSSSPSPLDPVTKETVSTSKTLVFGVEGTEEYICVFVVSSDIKTSSDCTKFCFFRFKFKLRFYILLASTLGIYRAFNSTMNAAQPQFTNQSSRPAGFKGETVIFQRAALILNNVTLSLAEEDNLLLKGLVGPVGPSPRDASDLQWHEQVS